MWASLIPPSLLLLAVGHPYFPVIDPSSEPAANAYCYAVGGVGVALTLAMVATAHCQFRAEEQS